MCGLQYQKKLFKMKTKKKNEKKENKKKRKKSLCVKINKKKSSRVRARSIYVTSSTRTLFLSVGGVTVLVILAS